MLILTLKWASHCCYIFINYKNYELLAWKQGKLEQVWQVHTSMRQEQGHPLGRGQIGVIAPGPTLWGTQGAGRNGHSDSVLCCQLHIWLFSAPCRRIHHQLLQVTWGQGPTQADLFLVPHPAQVLSGQEPFITVNAATFFSLNWLQI